MLSIFQEPFQSIPGTTRACSRLRPCHHETGPGQRGKSREWARQGLVKVMTGPGLYPPILLSSPAAGNPGTGVPTETAGPLPPFNPEGVELLDTRSSNMLSEADGMAGPVMTGPVNEPSAIKRKKTWWKRRPRHAFPVIQNNSEPFANQETECENGEKLLADED